MMKWIISSSVVVVVGGLVLFFALDGSAKKDDGLKTVAVTRGTIVEKALAVGKIEPKNEIAVKSKNGGIVKKIYAEVGTIVKIGDPLIDVQPDPTPVEYAEAKRQMELAQVSFDKSNSEYTRAISLNEKQLISAQEFDRIKATHDETELRLKMATEKLALIESGRTEIANRRVDNIIKSPINGMILSRLVEEGDPVVPLTSYQAGTELMTLAYMENLIFKGNVDEIDVGKLHEGMKAELEVGALSREKIVGTVVRISPKAHKEEGSTLFEVEIAIDSIGTAVLRAGYSANADIVIVKKDSVLMVPERLVKIEDSAATVEIKDSLGVVTPRKVKTGLSDGINIEIVEGLVDSELVVERPPKEITAD